MDEPRPFALTPVVVPGGVELGHLYSRPGLDVTVDRDAMEADPGGPAVVTIEDHERWMVYAVTAQEDEHGRARLIALTIATIEDPDAPFDRYIDSRPERSRDWLARIAIECARHAPAVRAAMDDDELLDYVARTAQRCEGEGINATQVLAKALHRSPRSISRLLGRAADAGLLPPRRRGRPRKITPKETPDV